LGDQLRSDSPRSVRNIARFVGARWASRSWGELLDCVITGKTGIQLALGAEPFHYLSEHPADAAVFDRAMTDWSRMFAAALADAYGFSRFKTIIDVAGGHGFLLRTILERYPETRGIVFDLPHVIEGTRKALGRTGLGDRCQSMAGDFFESVPAGGHAYILKSIIHDWDDESAIRILRNCRRAICRTGRLLVCEIVVPPPQPAVFRQDPGPGDAGPGRRPRTDRTRVSRSVFRRRFYPDRRSRHCFAHQHYRGSAGLEPPYRAGVNSPG